MTPEQISLVQSSFDRLGSHLPALTTRFYEELFDKDPNTERSSNTCRMNRNGTTAT